MNKGFTLAEVMVALLIVGLAVGPMFVLTQSSSESSKISGYEVMACQYANEISSQLNRHIPYLSILLDEAREKTHNSNIFLEHILADMHFLELLKEVNDHPVWVPFQCNGKHLGLSLYLSPLHPNFTDRSLKIEELETNGNQLLIEKQKYYKVEIKLSWVIPQLKSERIHDFSKVIFLYE